MGAGPSYRSHLIGLPADQPGSSGGSLPSEKGERYFGLTNVANTCYANSVLQALYFCVRFRKNAIRHLHECREDESSNDSLFTSMAELFAQIECQKRMVGCLTPRRFLAKLRKASDLFCTAEHQDAHEFMEFLLNDIAEHVKKTLLRQREKEKSPASPTGQGGNSGRPRLAGDPAPLWGDGEGASDEEGAEAEEPRTWVHDIFEGSLLNQMKCLCCENITVRRETFLDLSVDIEQHTSIAECLRTFESTELLRAENKFFCDMCGCLQEAEKRLRVYQLPSVLTLHLKRFKYVERLGRCCRLPYRVVFPLQLQVVEQRPQRRRGPRGGPCGNATAPPAGHSSRPGAGSDVAGVAAPDEDNSNGAVQRPPSRLFELRSVVVHIGRDSSRGHYVTVVRQGNRCVLLDDDVVRAVEPEVLRSFYGTAGDSVQGPDPGSSRSQGREGDGYSNRPHNTPLYEHSPEGTCCGYILFYEAVDGAPDPDHSVVDVSDVAEWISEECNLSDSDGETASDRPSPMQDQSRTNGSDDSELLQAFEQRCIPSRIPVKQRDADGAVASTPPIAAA
mmetsp:Transcript_93072/g.199604  ORF Transcript_93072/g.199604 Transcript_93072/m.199604 type:complete len:561 (-) Transcript_93072:60-1742(-)